MAQDLKNLIGARIRVSRLAKGLTQEQLAERIEKSVQTISSIERGKYMPAFDTLVSIAAALDLPVHTLLTERDDWAKPRDEKEFEALMILRQLSDVDLDLAISVLKAIHTKD